MVTSSTPYANIMPSGSVQEQGEAARLTSFVGAIAIGDLVKSTLGPKGLDKLITSGGHKGGDSFKITNDGATILQSLQLDNPAAKVLVSLSKGQDDAIGDGTTSVTVLAAELLREAERLIDQHRMHPQLIIQGYRIASDLALKALQDFAKCRPPVWLNTSEEHEGKDTSSTPASNRRMFNEDLLFKIAKTTLSSKVLASHHEHFAHIAVEAIKRLAQNPSGSVNIELIQYVKRPGGALSESYFVQDGFILPKPAGISSITPLKEPAKVLVANTAMDADKIKVFGAKVKATSPAQIAELERAERDKMRLKVQRIIATGCNVFVNRQLVYNWPEQLLHDANILCIEHADFEGVERVAAAVDARIMSTFGDDRQIKGSGSNKDDEESSYLGHCKRVEEVDVFGERMMKFSGLPENAHAGTIILRGATEVLLDEAERSLHDVLRVLSSLFLKDDPRTVLGAGQTELLMAAAIDHFLLTCSTTPAEKSGKVALAVEGFARALRALPTALADNAGLDSTDLIGQLKLLHAQHLSSGTFCLQGLLIPTTSTTSTSHSIDKNHMNMADIDELGVVESYQLKRQVIVAASEAAEMLLRVDYIFKEPPKPRGQDRCH